MGLSENATNAAQNLPRETVGQRQLRALERFRAYDTRPSTVAAKEFFGDSDRSTKSPLHWETLPERVDKLCQTLMGWVCRECC